MRTRRRRWRRLREGRSARCRHRGVLGPKRCGRRRRGASGGGSRQSGASRHGVLGRPHDQQRLGLAPSGIRGTAATAAAPRLRNHQLAVLRYRRRLGLGRRNAPLGPDRIRRLRRRHPLGIYCQSLFRQRPPCCRCHRRRCRSAPHTPHSCCLNEGELLLLYRLGPGGSSLGPRFLTLVCDYALPCLLLKTLPLLTFLQGEGRRAREEGWVEEKLDP